MLSKRSSERDVVSNHDTFRFGLYSVKGEIVGSHPLESLRQNTRRFWGEKKRSQLALTYGSAFNLRRDLDAQILSRFQRPPGVLPSSMLGYDAMTASLEDFGFEDYLSAPQDSETFQPPEMHHGMEVHLGLSKGPACRSFI